ncbi:hypothetical protein ACHAWF_008518 [Thalassiosira exigua]
MPSRRGSGGEGGGGGSPSSSKAARAFRDCLSSLDLPPSLLPPVLESYAKCQSRLWIVDNSSRMKVRDSHVGRGRNRNGSGEAIVERIDDVSRWEELQETFWLVNKEDHVGEKSGHQFSLCWNSPSNVPREIAHLRHAMNNVRLDQSTCPLAARVHSLGKLIAKQAPDLEASGGHITIVLCTQGFPTDGQGKSSSAVRKELRHELGRLRTLPVKVIIRMCTDDESVRDMFNSLDSTFESFDVLDDYWAEAMEVYLHNPWLTYGVGLHRLRESGFAPELLDDIDERPLNLVEIHELCTMLFGDTAGGAGIPHPKHGVTNFLRSLHAPLDEAKLQWNPVKKAMMPWINLKKLEGMIRRRRSDGRNRGNDSQRRRRHTVQDKVPEGISRANSEGSNDMRRRRAEIPKGYSRQTSGCSNASHHTSRETRDPSSLRENGHRRHSRTRDQGRASFTSAPRKRHTFNGDASHAASFTAGNAPRNRDTTSSAPASAELTLTDALKRWSHQPPDHKTKLYPLQHLLVTVPDTFPPKNSKVEDHDYFAKWKTFDKEAFEDEDGDALKELLKRAVRKAKFFLHPDKLPKDLTENQTMLFSTIWNTIADKESATLG